ncbi:5'-3' exoribonuclease [Lachnellula occidentalis]|uniref:5'-3' exoribonuclease n=1 Tax=Lachnellula occidentalis TaxID=215460 RepID=A0A8H8UKS8_9HELO|nr:5'-3' exoribonuclease [Lachnellula occidentalis]
MGVPALFRWLSQKYPKIVSGVIEEQPREIDGQQIPVDIRGSNPNGEEFDNLYLDMNGIVHPCSHPEDGPAPKDEEEMMLAIFKYTDRVVNMVRPRKLLMIAIDGVAPRAKMNQQRSRRFRSAQEAQEKAQDKVELAKMLKSQGGRIEEEEIKKAFDSNEITPGTPFMDTLAASLRYWIAYKLNSDPAWAKVKVIISDSTVPGEGEHKIMEFIRSQRSSPEHNPNTRHVIYGLDADLIMLGLATHEPHFRVLREDVFAQDSKPRTCRMCGQAGHEARECTGQAKVKDGEHDEKDSAPPLKPFIWLHVSVLREYLAAEMYVPDQPFRFDLERALDDWVFMCFFVGNDFLPHLPSLEIRENGIDTLIAIWRDNIPHMGGYLTKDGHVDLERAQFILAGLAKQEDGIFRRRKETEDRRAAGQKRRKLEQERRNGGGRGGRGGRGGFQDAPSNGGQNGRPFKDQAPVGLPLFAPGHGEVAKDAKAMTHDMVVNRGAIYKANLANKSAAAALKGQLSGSSNEGDVADASVGGLEESPGSALGKRKAELLEDDDSSTPGRNTPQPATPQTPSDEPPPDSVRLWDEGYADRYYEQKFGVEPSNFEFRHEVARAYVEGLAWVLLYYFQGCPSWDWYYPYHYAPFAADFVDIKDMKISFEKGNIFRPFEQLMGVLPAASRQAIPELFHDLMTEPESEIIDFYPEDFVVDLNGKKFAWQGVALLPFIDSNRLLSAMAKRYPLMPPEMAARNTVGKDALLFAEAHEALYADVADNFYSKKQEASEFKLNPRVTEGLTGKVEKNESYLPHGSLAFQLNTDAMPSLDADRSISVHYEMPKSKFLHKSMLLRGVEFPPAALNQGDIEQTKGRAAKSGRNHGGAPLNGGGRGRGSFNFAAPNHQQPHGSRNSYNGNNNYQPPPPPGTGWQPPPPGLAARFGGPPPPPPGNYGSYGQPPGYGGRGGQGADRGPPGYSRPNESDSWRGGGRGGGNTIYRGRGESYRGGDSYRGGGSHRNDSWRGRH